MYFWWLARQAAGGLLVVWPVTLGILVWIAFGIRTFVSKSNPLPLSNWLLQLVPIVFPLCILALGAVFACPNCTPFFHRRHWAGYAVDALTFGQLVSAVWLVNRTRGARSLSSALQALFLWYSLWAGFISGMSISGDWI